MPEETALEVGEPLVVEDVVIRPIARRRLVGGHSEAGAAIVGLLRPVGILVEDDGTVQALDLDGDPIPEGELDDLEVPGRA